jgi:hypothetical protein
VTGFSGVRASFFAGLSNIIVRRTPEKNNGILGSPSIFLSIDSQLILQNFCPGFGSFLNTLHNICKTFQKAWGEK